MIVSSDAKDLVLEKAESKSVRAAKRIRQLLDESGGSLALSPAKECRRLQINLSMVSKQFKKLHGVTIRAYSRQVRMKTAEKLLRESNGPNVDEAARLLGYAFTSAFSRCFRNTFGKRPKRYQIECGSNARRGMNPGSMDNSVDRACLYRCDAAAPGPGQMEEEIGSYPCRALS